MIAARRRNHAIYQALLGGSFYVQRPEPGSKTCSISFGLLAKDPKQRRRIVKALEQAGVETRIFSAGNLGLHPFWSNRYGKASFPFADRIHHTGFFLPNNPALSPEMIRRISRIVLEAA